MNIIDQYLTELFGKKDPFAKESEEKTDNLWELLQDIPSVLYKTTKYPHTRIYGSINEFYDSGRPGDFHDERVTMMLYSGKRKERIELYNKYKKIVDKEFNITIKDIQRDWSKLSILLKQYLKELPEFVKWFNTNKTNIKQLKKPFLSKPYYDQCLYLIKSGIAVKKVSRMGSKKFATNLLNIPYITGKIDVYKQSLKYIVSDDYTGNGVGIMDDHTYNHMMIDY